MNTFDLPTQYEPYGTLRIGSNILRNVKALASVGSNVPILIGKGRVRIVLDRYRGLAGGTGGLSATHVTLNANTG